MTTPSPAVTVSAPPRAVLRMSNPIVNLLVRIPIGTGFRGRYLILDFAGRKSGKPYHFPVRVHSIDGGIYVVTNKQWRLNFRGGTGARITLNGKTLDFRADLIEDPQTVADLLLRLTREYGPKAQHKLALRFGQGSPTRDDFVDVVDREHLAAIHFTPA